MGNTHESRPVLVDGVIEKPDPVPEAFPETGMLWSTPDNLINIFDGTPWFRDKNENMDYPLAVWKEYQEDVLAHYGDGGYSEALHPSNTLSLMESESRKAVEQNKWTFRKTESLTIAQHDKSMEQLKKGSRKLAMIWGWDIKK